MNHGAEPNGALDLDDRYGRIKTTSDKLGRAFTVTLLVTLFAWLIWAANYHSDPEVKVSLISFKAINEKSMGINFQITRRDPAQPIECTLVAVDIDKYVVGEINYRIESGKKREVINTVIPTRSYSVSALISRCAAAN